MESQDYYRCTKCPMIGPARELETHLAEHHLDYRPHHCHTCGRRAYDRAVIFDECGSLKHNVALWQVRAEAKERQLAADLKKCLSLPVAVIEQKVAPRSDAVTVTVAALADSPDSGIFAADSSSIASVTQENTNHFGTQAMVVDALVDGPFDSGIFVADSSSVTQENTDQSGTQAMEADATGTTAVGATPPSTSRLMKRRHDPTVHTVMTCHYTGCGEEIALSGAVAVGHEQKRHVQERHLPRPLQNIHCPVVQCKRATGERHFSNVYNLCSHLKKRHGGVNALSVEQRAAYRATQKQVLDASDELIRACFPQGSVTRNEAAAKRTCRCAKCGEKVSAHQFDFRQTQKRHIEMRHMEASAKIACPMEGCHKTWDTLVSLEWHLVKGHSGLTGLSVEQRTEHHALKKHRNAAIDAIFAHHFSEDD